MTEPNKIPEINPESYRPKKPEILNIAETAANSEQQTRSAAAPAASTIPQTERNTVRIVELPACKMVTSGPANGKTPSRRTAR